MARAHLGVDGVGDTEDSHDYISHVIAVVVRLETPGDVTRRARPRGEGKSVADSELREMNVDLGGVDGFSTEVLVHLLRADACSIRGDESETRFGVRRSEEEEVRRTLVVESALNSVAISLSGNRLQESGASSAGRERSVRDPGREERANLQSWRSQNDEHLARADQSVHVPENVDAVSLLPHELLSDADGLKGRRADRNLVV